MRRRLWRWGGEREQVNAIRLEVERSECGAHSEIRMRVREAAWSPTYSQLLALAERSAQLSIRTHRRTHSSVISRRMEGRSVRAGIIPRWTRVVEERAKKKRQQDPEMSVNPSSRIQWIRHRGGAQLRDPSTRFSRALCHSSLRGDRVTGVGGEEGCFNKKKWYIVKSLERLGLSRIPSSEPTCARSLSAARKHAQGETRAEVDKSKPIERAARWIFFLLHLLFLLSERLITCCRVQLSCPVWAQRALQLSQDAHTHTLSVSTHGSSSYSTVPRCVCLRRECVSWL